MKKLTLIALGVTLVGISIPLIDRFLFMTGIPVNFAFGLTSIGFFALYIFFNVWQAEKSRKRLMASLSVSVLIMLTFIIYANIKATEAQETASTYEEFVENSASELSSAKQEITETQVELAQAKAMIESLNSQLQECR